MSWKGNDHILRVVLLPLTLSLILFLTHIKSLFRSLFLVLLVRYIIYYDEKFTST